MQENQGKGTQGPCFKADIMSAKHQIQRIPGGCHKQGGEIGQRVQAGTKNRFPSAEIEYEHEDDAGIGIIKIPQGNNQEGKDKKPPFLFFKAPYGKKAYK